MFSFSFADVINQANILLFLQNSFIVEGTDMSLSPLLASITTGIECPPGSVTLSRKSMSH